MHKHGKTKEAVEAFRKAIEMDSSYANAHYALGQAFEAKGYGERAIKEYEVHIMINETGWTVDDSKARVERLKSAVK